MSLICAVHCSYAHGCGAIQWSMVHLPAAIHLRKIDSHILKAINYQQLLSWEALPHPMLDLNGDWIALIQLFYRQPQLL